MARGARLARACRAPSREACTMEEFLRLRGIHKSFVGVYALKGVDLSLRQGEIHALVGENGSGKSTLIKIISGVLQPDRGEISVEGRHVDHQASMRAIASGIQVIYQDLSLFPNLTVAENIALSELEERRRALVDWNEVRRVARAAMARIKVALDLDAEVGELPVGMQQLVAICRALTSDLKLLILDEPTASLTRRDIDNLLTVVRDLQASGIAVLFVSHKLEEVFAVAERITVLRDGQTVATLPRPELTDEKLVALMTGHAITASRFHLPEGERRKVLEVRGLTKRHNFADVSFDLEEGEIVGLTGLIGSGRTELALALFGVSPADSGTIRVDGRPVRIASVQDAVGAGIAYVPENRLVEGLIMKRSVEDNLTAPVLERLRGRSGSSTRGGAPPPPRAGLRPSRSRFEPGGRRGIPSPAATSSGSSSRSGSPPTRRCSSSTVPRSASTSGAERHPPAGARAGGEGARRAPHLRRAPGGARQRQPGPVHAGGSPPRGCAYRRTARRGRPAHRGGAAMSGIARLRRQLLRHNETYLALLILLLVVGITAANPAFLSFENVAGFLEERLHGGHHGGGYPLRAHPGGYAGTFPSPPSPRWWSTPSRSSPCATAATSTRPSWSPPRWERSMGLVNGLFIHFLPGHDHLVTIATFNIYFGMMYVITEGKLINNIHPLFKHFGNVLLFPTRSAIGGTYGLSLMPLIWLASLVLGWLILRRTLLGRGIIRHGRQRGGGRARRHPSPAHPRLRVRVRGLPLGHRGGGPPLHRAVGGSQHHRGQGAGGHRGGGHRGGQRVRGARHAHRHLPRRSALRRPQQRPHPPQLLVLLVQREHRGRDHRRPSP